MGQTLPVLGTRFLATPRISQNNCFANVGSKILLSTFQLSDLYCYGIQIFGDEIDSEIKLVTFTFFSNVVTKTRNGPQRPTTIHNDPQRSTTIHNDPTTIHNDPQRSQNDPQRSQNDPQRSHNKRTKETTQAKNIKNLTFGFWSSNKDLYESHEKFHQLCSP